MLHQTPLIQTGQDLCVRLPVPVLLALQESRPYRARQLRLLELVRELHHFADFLQLDHPGYLRL